VQKPFSYHNEYFHRPLLSEENKRLWSILSATAATVLVIHSFLLLWTSNISSVEIRAKIKSQYISFLSQQDLMAEPAPPAVAPEEMAPDSKSYRAQYSDVISPVKRGRFLPDRPTSVPLDITELVKQTDQLGFATISSAVEGVPGFAGIDFGRSRPEKKLYYRNEDKIFRSHQEHIHIPIPENIQFASQNGNRNLDETLAIMEANEIDIKYCFEKYSRFDPSMSGDVLLSFSIHPDGFVIPSTVRVLNSSVRDPRIIECIKKQVRRWRNFTPLAYEEGNFSVTRKYVF